MEENETGCIGEAYQLVVFNTYTIEGISRMRCVHCGFIDTSICPLEQVQYLGHLMHPEEKTVQDVFYAQDRLHCKKCNANIHFIWLPCVKGNEYVFSIPEKVEKPEHE